MATLLVLLIGLVVLLTIVSPFGMLQILLGLLWGHQ